MTLDEWHKSNSSNFGSEYEKLFAEVVLPLVPELNFDAISLQYPFRDRDGRQRYCDFVVNENDNVRIAIEIDGYDKRGTGEGMSHADFVDWQRRQAALTSLGWHVLRFANRDVRDDPKRCAEHISLLLKYARGKSKHEGLSDEEESRLLSLTEAQNKAIEYLKQETSTMKYAIASFTTLILILVSIIVWQSNNAQSKLAPAIAQSPAIPSPPATVVPRASNQSTQPVAVAHKPTDQSTQPVAAIDARDPYSDVLTTQGITCIDEDGPESIRKQSPRLRDDGLFVCPCMTDSGCSGVNPHINEDWEPPQDITKSPKGATCNNPINWDEAQQHIGQTWVVAGPLMKVTQRDNIQGSPTWLDVGATFPNTRRLMLIIWGKEKAEFPGVTPGQFEGKRVCVVGKIGIYKGVPQIELKEAGQLLVEK